MTHLDPTCVCLHTPEKTYFKLVQENSICKIYEVQPREDYAIQVLVYAEDSSQIKISNIYCDETMVLYRGTCDSNPTLEMLLQHVNIDL